VEFPGPAGRECRTCGARVIGAGPTLRHAGEAIRATPPAGKDARGFTAVIREVTSAVRALPDDTPRDQVVRAAVEVAYARGWLRRRRGTRRPWCGDTPEPVPPWHDPERDRVA
jgi:hypothetical protein